MGLFIKNKHLPRDQRILAIWKGHIWVLFNEGHGFFCI